MIQPDIWDLYRLMIRCRKYEEFIQELWEDGHILGEMHLGMGEEAINVGIISQLVEGDAIALDHRGTAAALLRGVDPSKLILEFLGDTQGICGGNGGHMHIFSRIHLIASSGIVGASPPTAVGFGLKMDYLNEDNIAVAFFGEGAFNEGIVTESLNLAAIWNLPVLFVCKDNDLSITTVSSTVTAGNIIDRVSAMGIEAIEINGTDVLEVWNAAQVAINFIRNHNQPYFIKATCVHKTGHFLGDPLLTPFEKDMLSPVLKGVTKRTGASLFARIRNVLSILKLAGKASRQTKDKNFPYIRIIPGTPEGKKKTAEIHSNVEDEIRQIRQQVLDIHFGGRK